MLTGRTRRQFKEHLESRNAHRANMWLLPYNRWGSHWALFIVDFVTEKIIHVDSLKCRPNSPDIIFIQQMIEAVTTPNIPMEWDRWQLGVSTSKTLQPDGYACATRVRFYAAVAAIGLSSSVDDSAMRSRIRLTIED